MTVPVVTSLPFHVTWPSTGTVGPTRSSPAQPESSRASSGALHADRSASG